MEDTGILTPETVQAVVLAKGDYSRTVDKARVSVLRNPSHTPAQPPACSPPIPLRRWRKQPGAKGRAG